MYTLETNHVILVIISFFRGTLVIISWILFTRNKTMMIEKAQASSLIRCRERQIGPKNSSSTLQAGRVAIILTGISGPSCDLLGHGRLWAMECLIAREWPSPCRRNFGGGAAAAPASAQRCCRRRLLCSTPYWKTKFWSGNSQRMEIILVSSSSSSYSEQFPDPRLVLYMIQSNGGRTGFAILSVASP